MHLYNQHAIRFKGRQTDSYDEISDIEMMTDGSMIILGLYIAINYKNIHEIQNCGNFLFFSRGEHCKRQKVMIKIL